MGIPSNPQPNADELRAVLRGIIPDDQIEALVAHLIVWARAAAEPTTSAPITSNTDVDDVSEITGGLLARMQAADLPAVQRVVVGNVLAWLGDPRFDPDAWYLPKLTKDEPLLGFVEIPAGPFLMGSDPQKDKQADDDEQPQHTLDLPKYYLARYPVTVAQWRAFVEDSGHKAYAGSLQGVDNHPVVFVHWREADEYCRWLTGKLRAWTDTPEPLARLLREQGWQVTLPSEAQWEKAARGTDGRNYPWGDEFDPQRCNVSETGIHANSPVGIFPAGASPYGLLDMSGNVDEWCATRWHGDLNNTDRVVRGGSFLSYRRHVRAACRDYNDARSSDVGWRVAMVSGEGTALP